MKTLEQIRAINESRIEPEVGESSKYLKYSDLMKAYAVSFAKDGGLGAASKKIKAAMKKKRKSLASANQLLLKAINESKSLGIWVIPDHTNMSGKIPGSI